MIALGLLRSRRIEVNGRSVLFTHIQRSNLLRQIAVDGFRSYETELVTLVESYPFKISKFVDGGANIGFYSILVSLTLPDVEVVAVEPFPANVTYMKELQRMNDLSFSLVEKALDEQSRDGLVLYCPTGRRSSALSSSASLTNSFSGTQGIFSNLPYETVTVSTTTLANVLGDEPCPALVKLDCEFNELSILQGSASVLGRDEVDFVVEIGIGDHDKEDVFGLFRGFGYGAYLITNAGLVREDRPLTFPYPHGNNRTIWRNHLFTKRSAEEIRAVSLARYGYWI